MVSAVNDYMSGHVDNDHHRHYFFSRNSGLPVGYFPRQKPRRRWPSVDRVVFVCVILIGVLAACLA